MNGDENVVVTSKHVVMQLGRWRVVHLGRMSHADEVVDYILEYMQPDAMGRESWRMLCVLKVPLYNTGPTIEAFMWEMFNDMDRGVT